MEDEVVNALSVKDSAGFISVVSQIEDAIERAESVYQLKAIESRIVGVEAFVRAEKMHLDQQNRVAELRLVCRRRAGAILAEAPKAKGGRGKTSVTMAGVSETERVRLQREAAVPEPEFRRHVESTKAAKGELTAAGVRRLAKVRDNSSRNEKAKSQTGIVDSLESLTETGAAFGTIYADPPWAYGNQATRAATDNHYPTMTVDEICAMPVAKIAAKVAHLHLWTTNAFLFEAKRVMEAWGFEYKSCFVWVKPQMGIGNYWRVSHEFLLLGTRGNATFTNKALKSWAELPRGRHSSKPGEIRKMIEKASPDPRIELFARNQFDGWTVLGNQIERSLYDANA